MRIFVTGATGFIGSRVVQELLGAGHQVLGMTRSDAGAAALLKAGAEVHRGTLEDPASVAAGAAQADGVIHTAFDHNFANFAANCEKDRQVIRAMGAALAGSRRPLLITSGTGLGDPGNGEPAREDIANFAHPNPRKASEEAAQELLDAGVSVSVVRLPQVHDTVKQGFVSILVQVASEKRVCAYIGEGRNRWPAGHVLDVAHLYRLALERNEAGARYHAVGEEGIAIRDIAQVVGAGLQVPVISISAEQAMEHYGWFAGFAGMDLAATSDWTRKTLGWTPTGPTMIEDLKHMDYAAAASKPAYP
ncbi:SDR family oxidoreductase [Solimonas marina]|uniref:SDR family oxidoreductase n=1 Tax=Solimonas marina TaxID=2714601 RepID=A0A969W6M8_9GAMM|nr:SDR family oxidoreductase [Solimonas marina]NKF20879.1 SDR family oxidoreductase [Solimonas marina]